MSLLNRLRLSRKLAALFATLSIIAGVTLSTIYMRLREMDAAAHFVDRTTDIRNASANALLAMINQQSGLRGYLITGDERFLAPYRNGTAEFAKQVAEANRLIHDPTQQQRWSDVARLADAWHALAENAIRLRASPDTREEALQLEMKGLDKAAMDKVRAAAQEFNEVEENLLKERRQAGDAVAASAKLYAIGGGILMVLTAIIAGFL